MIWFPISIVTATGLHLIWALGLLIDPMSRNATAVHVLLLIAASTHVAALMLITVAVAALVGAIIPEHNRVLRIMLILPQQCILIVSSMGAAEAMLSGSYADGTGRSTWFIIVDQVPIILLAVGYTMALSRIILHKEGRHG